MKKNNELPEHLKNLQPGQKVYLKSMGGFAVAKVFKINKVSITLSGLGDLSKGSLRTNKLNKNGIVKGYNEFHDLHICTRKEYVEQKKAFGIMAKFRQHFRFMPNNLSVKAKEKILSIYYQDRAGKL